MDGVVTADRGLGTAYERMVFYQLLERWVAESSAKTFLEGPVDGMAGIRGVFGVGLTRRGVSVVSAHESDEAAACAESVYRAHGAAGSYDVRVVGSPDELPPSDVVLCYHALSSVPDFRSYLQSVAKLAQKTLIVTVCNPDNWGVRIVRTLGRIRGRALDVPESWRGEVLAPLLWELGRVREHVYFDCPWWPDLQVAPGQSLKDRVLGMVSGRTEQLEMTARTGALAERFVYAGERWPYFGGPGFEDELGPAMRRHPNFEASRLAKTWGHLHAYVVDMRPRPAQAARAHLRLV